MASISAPMQQNAANSGMLAKLNFPKEALVLSGIYKTLFDALIKVALMLCILPVFHVRPGWGLALFPLGVASLVLAGTAIGLALTPIGMLYADIGKALPLVLQFFMYVTPVVFAIPETGRLVKVFLLNPVTPLILNARDWLTGQPPRNAGVFRRRQRRGARPVAGVLDGVPPVHADSGRKVVGMSGNGDTLIKVEHVSKKFCLSLKKSLWYGLKDMGKELLGLPQGNAGHLRPKEFWAVNDVSFEVKRGECLGLIGRNGAGKTTLLKMLNGLIKPDTGRIEMRGLVEKGLALPGIGQVGGQDPAGARAERGEQGFGVGAGAVAVDPHGGAGVGQCAHDGGTDAARPAGNQRRSSYEGFVHNRIHGRRFYAGAPAGARGDWRNP